MLASKNPAANLHMIGLKTRFATDADAEVIAALVNAAFKVERFFIDRDRIDPGKVREMLRTGKYLLAEDSGALIACMYVELRGKRAYLRAARSGSFAAGPGPRTKDGGGSGRLRAGGGLRIHGFTDRQFARRTTAILSAAGICRNGH
ncbi:MAG: hypothetical protein WCC03_21850 [Candidatus Acidiferrales bacterium]